MSTIKLINKYKYKSIRGRMVRIDPRDPTSFVYVDIKDLDVIGSISNVVGFGRHATINLNDDNPGKVPVGLAVMGPNGEWEKPIPPPQTLPDLDSMFELKNKGTPNAYIAAFFPLAIKGDVYSGDNVNTLPPIIWEKMPVASTVVLGGVKVDGVTIMIVDGVISAAAGVRSVIPFSSTKTPSVNNYQDEYASKHGEHPIVQLKVVDEDGEWQRNETAKFIRNGGGLLDSIVWDLPDPVTGFIILM